MASDFLKISPRITVLPIIHGSGDCALEVRRVMLTHPFDCLAVPLPQSFQTDVEDAIHALPSISAVIQEEPAEFGSSDWDPDFQLDATEFAASYVPIDPCQGVIAALRIALQERVPRAFIDLETEHFESLASIFPDPYALKRVPMDRFAAALLAAVPRLPEGQPQERVVTMANRLRQLETHHRSILLVCSVVDWPWIKNAYFDRIPQSATDAQVNETRVCPVAPQTLAFFLAELPFITGLYERARKQLDDDQNLTIDGIKELLLTTRDRYARELKSLARRITPKLLSVYFQYVRNLALIERRLTPDLYTLVVAAQQIAGDQFAIQLAETAREYPYQAESDAARLVMGLHEARLPDGRLMRMINRLPGHSITWRSCRLKPRPPKKRQRQWQMRWDPFRQCSWPPEDSVIEQFRTRVQDAALAIMGADLARSEKFTTSLKDGLDMRETLRNWHTGDLYVKVFPPTRGNVDCVLMFFDSPADPRDYPWRATWMAEHDRESTLALFATDFSSELVGPGIGVAKYGGALMLFPPRSIPDIWQDPRFDAADTLEERLLLAGCFHATERHIAVLSQSPPGPAWRRIAKRYAKKLVHVPLNRFSQETIQKLRMVHVLNGQQVRSYAVHFIRKA